MQDLVKVSQSTIGGVEVNSVNLRDVFKFIVSPDSETKFADWVKVRLKRAKIGSDFAVQRSQTKNNPQGGRPLQEYITTTDLAKSICMLEDNAKGDELRQYFIDSEKKLTALLLESAKPKTVEASLEETCKLCADLTFEEVQQLADKLVRSVHTKKLQDVHGSYAYYYEYWKSVSENTTFSMLEVSKELGLGRTTFMSLLRSEGILLADARIPAQRFVDEGKVIVVRTAWFDKRGNPHEEYVTRFTVKGRELMIKGVYDRIRKRHDGDIKAFKEELKIRLKDRMLDLPNDSTFLPDFDATHEQLVNNILPREKFIENSLK